MTARSWWIVGVALGLTGLAATSYLLMMTTFMFYDDEGFVLMTLRRFLGGEPLYDTVFTQYGPTPYLYHWLLTGGGRVELTHMLGRCITLGHWLVCALGSGWIASRLVDRFRRPTGILVTLTSFNLLWKMTHEPTHPGSLIAALVTLGGIAGVHTLRAGRPTAFAVWMGVVGAALVFTKINVGLFFVTAVGALALFYSDWPGAWRRICAWLATGGLGLLPWLLMAGNLDESRFQLFAFKASLGGLGLGALLLAQGDLAPRAIKPRIWWRSLAAFAGTAAIIIAFVVLRHTSLSELIRTVLLDPLRLPAHFSFGPPEGILSTLASIGGFAFVVLCARRLQRDGDLGPSLNRAVIALRLLLLLAFVMLALRWPSLQGALIAINYMSTLIPLWLIPAGTDSRGTPVATSWVGLLALLQILHAYPVAGSQVAWGCFLGTVLFGVAANRDLRQLARGLPRSLSAAPAAAVLLAAATGTCSLAVVGWQRYSTSQPLPFPGATDIRLDDRSRILLTTLVENAMVHSDVLFTRQGMYSYNIWSGVSTPTARNATHWFWLLDDREQAEIITRLRAPARAAIIVNRRLDEFLRQAGVPTHGPLQEHIATTFRPLFHLGDFQFLTHPGVQAVPLGVVEILLPDNPGSLARSSLPALLRGYVLIAGAPASLQIMDTDAHGNLVESPLEAGAPSLTAARKDGATMDTTRRLAAAGPLHGIYLLTAPIDAGNAADYHGKFLILRDASGGVLAETMIE